MVLKYKNRKRLGFSDKLYVLNLLCVWLFVIATIYLTANESRLDIRDMSAISSAIPCAFGELGIHTGFIVWKSKVENCRKFKDVNRLERLESEVD